MIYTESGSFFVPNKINFAIILMHIDANCPNPNAKCSNLFAQLETIPNFEFWDSMQFCHLERIWNFRHLDFVCLVPRTTKFRIAIQQQIQTTSTFYIHILYVAIFYKYRFHLMTDLHLQHGYYLITTLINSSFDCIGMYACVLLTLIMLRC